MIKHTNSQNVMIRDLEAIHKKNKKRHYVFQVLPNVKDKELYYIFQVFNVVQQLKRAMEVA